MLFSFFMFFSFLTYSLDESVFNSTEANFDFGAEEGSIKEIYSKQSDLNLKDEEKDKLKNFLNGFNNEMLDMLMR